MPITLEMLADGLVISSLFLMAISVPKIYVTLALTTIRFRFLEGNEDADEFFQHYPFFKRWIPDMTIQAWRDLKKVPATISGELKRLTDLGKPIVESIIAASFLMVAAAHLGVDEGAAVTIALMILFLIASIVIGSIITLRHMARLTKKLNEANEE